MIWEESKNRKRKKMQKENYDKKDIINNIQVELKKEISPDTMKKFVRICPKCQKNLFYKSLISYKRALKLNTVCKSCNNGHSNKIPYNKKHYITERNCPKCNKIIKYPSGNICYKAGQKNRVCRECNGTAIKHSKNPKEWHRKCPTCNKDMFYLSLKGYLRSKNKNSLCIKCATIIASNKDSVRLCRRVRRLRCVTPCFNKTACMYFDMLNLERNWNLQHALNGGEIKVLGYSLDAYDKEKNIVVEYDEPSHYTKDNKLKIKDVNRQEEIINELNCKFYRYNECTQTLYEVTVVK
jgi:hypothetical protein